MNDIRQTRLYADYIKNLGWSFEKLNGIYCYIKKLPLIGFIIKIQRQTGVIGKDLLNYLEKKYKYSVIYIEPSTINQRDNLLKLGYKRYNSPFLPTKTIRINLTRAEKTLLTQMHSKTRYNIKHAQKNIPHPVCEANSTPSVYISTSNNIETFANFWQKTSLSWGMFLPETRNIKGIFSAFGDDAKIFFAKKNGTILGGILLISTKDVSYYMYAAYNEAGKRLFAPTLLVWEAIKYAKSKGKKIFDFEGIYDERYPLKTWRGFSRFKQSFGGKVVEFPGPLVKSSLPFGIIF
jgi:lipid II:glycine glycyltransferase (peptidoglycan interpeptide bridge formation enzyme)